MNNVKFEKNINMSVRYKRVNDEVYTNDKFSKLDSLCQILLKNFFNTLELDDVKTVPLNTFKNEVYFLEIYRTKSYSCPNAYIYHFFLSLIDFTDMLTKGIAIIKKDIRIRALYRENEMIINNLFITNHEILSEYHRSANVIIMNEKQITLYNNLFNRLLKILLPKNI